MQSISAEEVRAQVRSFWRAYCNQSQEEFEQFYFPDATVLEFDGRRIEPGRLMVARRLRELFPKMSSVSAELGPVDVQIVEPGIGVACYGYHFHVIRAMPNGKRYESDIPLARATHVFQRDEQGRLRIIHEHMSAGAFCPPVELPDKPRT
jgi:ketosteroid isomerase-like protein